MILRRMYLKNKSYAWYFHPEITTYHEFLEFLEANPQINDDALDNATYFFDALTKEEQINYWFQTYHLVMSNTRWVLDNLDNMCEYKVGWNNYGGRNGTTVGKPPSQDDYKKTQFLLSETKHL